MDDLDALIEAVEAGVISTDLIMNAIPEPKHQVICLAAFDGSREAAFALHEALLPGWDWRVDGDGHTFIAAAWPALIAEEYEAAFAHAPGLKGSEDALAEHKGVSDDPARAWLLAILRAVRDKPPS